MPALGERGSATRARSLLCGGGRAGVTGALLAEPIPTGKNKVGQGPARGEEGTPGPDSSFGRTAARASTPDAEFQTSRHAPCFDSIGGADAGSHRPPCETRLQCRKPLGWDDVYHEDHWANAQRLGLSGADAAPMRGLLFRNGFRVVRRETLRSASLRF